MMKRFAMWLLSKLFPYRPPSAAEQSRLISIIEATRKS